MDVFTYQHEAQSMRLRSVEAARAHEAALVEYTGQLDEHTELVALGKTAEAKKLSEKIKTAKAELDRLESELSEDIEAENLALSEKRFAEHVDKQFQILDELQVIKGQYLAKLTEINQNQHAAARISKTVKLINRGLPKERQAPVRQMRMLLPGEMWPSEYELGRAIGNWPLWSMITD